MDRTSVERVRRWRNRQASNSIFIMGDMPYSLAAALLDMGAISDEDSENPRKYADALFQWALRKMKSP